MDLCAEIRACLEGTIPTSETQTFTPNNAFATAVAGAIAGGITASPTGPGIIGGIAVGGFAGLVGGFAVDLGEWVVPSIAQNASDAEKRDWAIDMSELFDEEVGYSPGLLFLDESYKVYDNIMQYAGGQWNWDAAMEPFRAIEELRDTDPTFSHLDAVTAFDTLAISPFLYPYMLTSEAQVGNGSLLDIVTDNPLLIDDLAQSSAYTSMLATLIGSEELRVLLADQIFSIVSTEEGLGIFDMAISETINNAMSEEGTESGLSEAISFAMSSAINNAMSEEGAEGSLNEAINLAITNAINGAFTSEGLESGLSAAIISIVNARLEQLGLYGDLGIIDPNAQSSLAPGAGSRQTVGFQPNAPQPQPTDDRTIKNLRDGVNQLKLEVEGLKMDISRLKNPPIDDGSVEDLMYYKDRSGNR